MCLARGHAAIRVQHHHAHAGLAMEGRCNRGTGITGGGDDNRQIAALAGLQLRQRTGQEARTDVLERRRRPMEQLQHMVNVAQRAQRYREVERFAADRRKRGLQCVTSKERCQQIGGGIGQRRAGLQLAWRRQHLRNIQPAIGRQSGGDRRAEANGRRLAAGRNKSHGFGIQ